MKKLLLAAALAAALAGCGQAPAAHSETPEYRRALGHASLLAYSGCRAGRLSPAAVNMIKLHAPETTAAVKAEAEAAVLAMKRKLGNEFSFCAELEATLAPSVDRANDLALTQQLMR